MFVRTLRALFLAAALALVLAPCALVARADIPEDVVPRVMSPTSRQSAALGPSAGWLSAPAARVAQPSPQGEQARAAPAEVEPAPAEAQPAPPPQPDLSFLNDELREQTEYKLAREARLRELNKAPATRLGEIPDGSQVSIAGPIERGILSHPMGTRAAYAYVQPYREPNLWAYRNYCAAGAAITLLSHWDPGYPVTANIDQLGAEIGINPNAGAWIRNITAPVNRRVNAFLGEELNWYRFGHARSLEEFRWIIQKDIIENGMPFITGVMTRGLPGWGSKNVGHIVCVYGYTQMPDGTEYVSYADTAQPASGYSGYILRVWELQSFWRAVSGNSAQVW
ncbi:MAG: C39 family peptidase [Anaerolineae bacterium]|nr:C39 family peptidase [Anaerolineae bacterium]